MIKNLGSVLEAYVPCAWFVNWPEYASAHAYKDLLFRELDIFFDLLKTQKPNISIDIENYPERALYFSLKSQQALELNWVTNYIEKIINTGIMQKTPLPQVTLELSQNMLYKAQKSIITILDHINRICVITSFMEANDYVCLDHFMRLVKSFDKIVVLDIDFSDMSLELWQEYCLRIVQMPIDGFSISFKQPQDKLHLILDFFTWLDFQAALLGYESDGFYTYVKNNVKDNVNSVYMNIYRERLPLKGLGLGAESFFGFTRAANIGNVDDYRASLESWLLPYEKIDFLTADQIRYEQIILGLRNKLGISLEMIMKRFSYQKWEILKKRSELLVRKGFLSFRDEAGEGSEAIKLTRAGLFQDDQIVAWLLHEY